MREGRRRRRYREGTRRDGMAESGPRSRRCGRSRWANLQRLSPDLPLAGLTSDQKVATTDGQDPPAHARRQIFQRDWPASASCPTTCCARVEPECLRLDPARISRSTTLPQSAPGSRRPLPAPQICYGTIRPVGRRWLSPDIFCNWAAAAEIIRMLQLPIRTSIDSTLYSDSGDPRCEGYAR